MISAQGCIPALSSHHPRADGATEIAIAIKEFKSAPNASSRVEGVSRMSVDMTTQAFIEVSIMKHPFLETHPNILHLVGITDNSGFVSSIPFQFCLVTEYASLGSLQSYITRNSMDISSAFKADIMFDIVAGLEALHSCNVVHNDIMAGNILLFPGDASQSRITAKVSDFGCSVPLFPTRPVARAAGTRMMAPPEAYSPQCIVDTSRDIYSSGIVLLSLLAESSPFTELSEDRLLELKESPSQLRKYIDEFLQLSDWVDNANVISLLQSLMGPKQSERLVDIPTITIKLNAVFSLQGSDPVDPQDGARFNTDWLLDVLHSVQSSPTIDELFVKFRERSRATRTFGRRRYEQFYSDSRFRSERQNDATAALQVALCYAYGIGVASDWVECTSWLRKATSMGDYIALIFLNRLDPELDVLPSGDMISGLLLQICQKKLRDGAYEEASIIADLLEEIDAETYEREHASLGCYCCEVLSNDNLPNNATTEQVLCHVWCHVANFPNDPLPTELEQELKSRKESFDSSGRTLLHYIAACRHPHLMEIDIVRSIAEILIGFGFDPAAKSKSGDTALSLAVNAKNINVINVLLNSGVIPDEDMLKMVTSRHESKILKRIIPFTRLSSYDKDYTGGIDILELLNIAVDVLVAERKLRHGTNYTNTGAETIDCLYQFAAHYGIQMKDFREELLQRIVVSGNSDLFQYFCQNLPREAYTRMLPLVIEAHQRDIFLSLLDYGAETNSPFKSGKYSGQHLLTLCAAEIGLDSFFYDTLITRDDILTESKRSIAERLVRNPMAGNALADFLNMYPEILQYSATDPENDVLLTYAVAFGFPQTVEPIIRKGGYIEAIEADDGGALLIASALTRPECLENLKILLSNERNVSDPGKQTRLGMALVAACQWGNLRAIKYLLDSGANPNYENDTARGVEDRSPFIAARFRRMMHQDNSDSTMMIQTEFEEAKFMALYRMLKEKGLDENRKFGPEQETAEEYCKRIMKTHHYDGEKLKPGVFQELEDALQNLQAIFGDYIPRTPDGGAMWVGPDILGTESENH